MADRCRIGFLENETTFPLAYPQGDIVLYTAHMVTGVNFLTRISESLGFVANTAINTTNIIYESFILSAAKTSFAFGNKVYYKQKNTWKYDALKNQWIGVDVSTGDVTSPVFLPQNYENVTSIAETRDFIYLVTKNTNTGTRSLLKVSKSDFTSGLGGIVEELVLGYFTNYYNYDCALLDENSIITSDSSLYLTINAFNNGGVPNFSTRMPYGTFPGYWFDDIQFCTAKNKTYCWVPGGSNFFGSVVEGQQVQTPAVYYDVAAYRAQLKALYPTLTDDQAYVWPYSAVTNGDSFFIDGASSIAGGIMIFKTDLNGIIISARNNLIGGIIYRSYGGFCKLWD
jgi:hypothetical protein